MTDSEKTSVTAYGADGRMVIRHMNGRLPETLDELGAALASASELNLFVHGGRLVRVHLANGFMFQGVYRPPGALAVRPVEASALVELAGLACGHAKWDGRAKDYMPCDCPRRVVEAYIARGYWPDLYHLSGFLEAPTIDLSGRLIADQGYDPATGLFIVTANNLSCMNLPGKKPSRKGAENALARLENAVSSFPFVSDSDMAAALAAFLSALVRRVLPSCPMFAITSPTPGTGKSLLSDGVAIVATGRRASVMAVGIDESETEKRLGGVLLAGDQIVALDNIERPLSGDLLCQVLTQPEVKLRPLGVSQMLSVPTNALLLATGNNLAITGDLKRRVCLVRLDAKTERPERRVFEHDFLHEIARNRGALIAAALTITAAYIAAGEPIPEGYAPAGSFADWDRMVRRPLMWLGYPDPLGSAEALRDTDPELETMRAFFTAWQAVPALSGIRTAAEIVRVGMEYSGINPSCPELYDALQVACAEKPNTRRLGNWMRARRDRIVDGMQLKQAGRDPHSKAARWEIVSCR